MKKLIIVTFIGMFFLSVTSCTNSEEPLTEEEETEVEEMLDRDQERMDSMRKAIEQQMQDSE